MRWHQAREVLRLAMMASVLSVSTPSLADVRNGFLRVPSMFILVEGLGEEAAACGVTEDGLDAAVRLTLDASRVPIQEGSFNPYVYVNVTVITVRDVCVAAVTIEYKRMLQLLGGSEYVTGAVWIRGTLLSVRRDEFGRHVYSRIEGFTKELIAEWLKANPR